MIVTFEKCFYFSRERQQDLKLKQNRNKMTFQLDNSCRMYQTILGNMHVVSRFLGS